MTTDMDDDKRWTIKSFDFKNANKKETPPMNESVTAAQAGFTPQEEEFLERHGFYWVPSDKEWFNDSGHNGDRAIYKDGAEYVLRSQIFIDDYQAEEDYDHFKTFVELLEYIR